MHVVGGFQRTGNSTLGGVKIHLAEYPFLKSHISNNTDFQVGRRSLMALGTLVSHKESFVENENGFDKQENLLLSSPNNGKLIFL